MTGAPRKPNPKEQIADAVLDRFVSHHPELRQNTVVTEIPPSIRWAGIVLAAIMTLSASTAVIWLVSSVSEMQVTLARMDERMASWISQNKDQYADLERRIEKIENRMNEGKNNAAK